MKTYLALHVVCAVTTWPLASPTFERLGIAPVWLLAYWLAQVSMVAYLTRGGRHPVWGLAVSSLALYGVTISLTTMIDPLFGNSTRALGLLTVLAARLVAAAVSGIWIIGPVCAVVAILRIRGQRGAG